MKKSYIESVYSESAYISSTSTIKYLRMHLLFFQILEIGSIRLEI